MRKLLTTLLLALLPLATWAADGDEFTASTAEGVTMTFKVISESAKTCQVGGTMADQYNYAACIPTSYNGEVTIPTTAGGYTVTEIGINAFRYSPASAIHIPEGIQRLNNNAFWCSNLTSLEIPASVTEIVEGAGIASCANLTSLTVSSANTVYSSMDANIVVEKAIGRLVAGCKTSTFPRGITSIGPRAFSSCNLAGATITLPEGITTLEENSFYAAGIRTINLPSTLTSIARYALSYNDLHSFVLPASVTTLSDGFLEGNSDLQVLVVDSTNTTYDSRQNCNAIINKRNNRLVQGCNTTVIPQGVTALGWSSFQGMNTLTTLIIPEGVTDLGDYTCYPCEALQTLSIPSTVTYIGKTTFYDCRSLRDIYCYIRRPFALDMTYQGPFGTNYTSDNSYNTYANATLHVPAGSSSAYANTAGWNKFANIVEMTGDSGATVINYRSYPTDLGTPRTTTWAAEQTMYLWNVGKGGFYINHQGGTGSPFWGTRASVNNMLGTPVTFTRTNPSGANEASAFTSAHPNAYLLVSRVTVFGDYRCTFADSYSGVWTDNNSNQYRYWNVTKQANGNIKIDRNVVLDGIDPSATNDGEGHYLCATKYGIEGQDDRVLFLHDEEADAAGNQYFHTDEEYYEEWAAVSPDDYEAWYMPIRIHEAAELLLDDILAAQQAHPTADLSGPIAVYNNSSSTLDDIAQARLDVRSAIKQAVFANIVEGEQNDVTGVLQNPDFEAGNTNGWTITWAGNSTEATNVGYQSSSYIYNGGEASLSHFVEAWKSGASPAYLGDGSISQTLSDMPAGKYMLAADIIANNQGRIASEENPDGLPDNVFLLTKAHDSINSLYTLNSMNVATPNESPRHFEMEFNHPGDMFIISLSIESTSETSMPANWIGMDNVKLYYYGGAPEPEPGIAFVDAEAKRICVARWDTNGDGELSEAEAAAVTTLDNAFTMDSLLTSFNELRYFTGLTSLGEAEFGGCDKLVSIQLPGTIQSIGKNAFRNCYQLREITLSEQLNTIGEQAFASCEQLAYIQIPDAVTAIGSHAFYACTSLHSVAYDNSRLKTIGLDAFAYCTSLESIYVPASVSTIDEAAFLSTTGVTVVNVDDNNTTYHSAGNAIIETASNTLIYGCVNTEIPGYVTAIADGAFYAQDIQSPALPEGLTTIGQIAFAACRNLTNIEIPASVTSIGYGAFYAAGLNAVTSQILQPADIDNSVFLSSNDTTNYEAMAYTYLNAPLYVPAGTKALYQERTGWREFANIVEMAAPDNSPIIAFADTITKRICVTNWDLNGDGELSENEAAAVTDLGKAFANSDITGFDELRYFTGLTELPNEAFSGCQYLTSIELPESVSSIGEMAFYRCGVSQLNLDNIERIGYRAFWNSNLSEVFIPQSVVEIGSGAFSGCGEVSTITVADDNEHYYSPTNSNIIIDRTAQTVIAGCRNSNIPDDLGIKAIGELAFSDVYTLQEITLPEGITTIDEWAFSFCSSLNRIILPASLREMGTLAFYGAPLQYVQSDATAPVGFDFVALQAFNDDVYENATLHVPAGTADIYRTTDGWRLFQNIEEEYVPPTLYPLTIVVNGEVVSTYELEAGADVYTLVEALTSELQARYGEGYEFVGWENLVESMPAEEWLITGEFREVQQPELADIKDAQGVYYVPVAIDEPTESETSSSSSSTTTTYAYVVKTYEGDLVSDVVIPDTIGGGYSVVGIQEGAFRGATALRSIVIPQSVTSVGMDVFRGATNLLAVEWNSPARIYSDCFDAPSTHGNLLLYVNTRAGITPEVNYQGNVILNGQTGSLTLDGERPLYVPTPFNAELVSYTRNFTLPTYLDGKASGWESIILPFDVETVTQSESGLAIAPFGTTGWNGAFYWLASMSESGFQQATTIEANRPYILAMPNNELYQAAYNITGDVTFAARNANVQSTAQTERTRSRDGLLFVGTYTHVNAADTTYTLNREPLDEYHAGGVFARQTDDVKPFEAYLLDTVYGNAKAFIPIFRSVADDIQHIWSSADGTADKAVYDLSGRRVATDMDDFMQRRHSFPRGVYVSGKTKFTY